VLISFELSAARRVSVRKLSFCYILQSESFFYAGFRSVKNNVIGSRIDSQIDEYKKVFDEIRRAITELATVEIEIRAVRLLSNISMPCSRISHCYLTVISRQ
jgi:hypothetical protein